MKLLNQLTTLASRRAALVCAVLIGITSTVWAQQSIIIVTDNQSGEAGYAEWLTNAGFEVTVSQSEEFQGALDATQQATLEGFDLVILSRNSNSGGYNHPAEWNGLDVPLLMHNPWLARDNRWDWLGSSEILDRNLEVVQVGSSRFADAHDGSLPNLAHPMFDGVTIDHDGEFPTVSLRSVGGNTNIVIADPGAGQWLLSDSVTGSQRSLVIDYTDSTGELYYPGSGQTIVNRRMYFSFGGEYTVTSAADWEARFTAEGERMLLNSIFYLGEFERSQELPVHADFGSVRFIELVEEATTVPFTLEPITEGDTIYIDEDTTVETLPAGLSGNLAFKTQNIALETVLEFGGSQRTWVDTNLNPAETTFPISFSIWTHRFDDGTNRNKIFGWFFDGGDNRGEMEIDARGDGQLLFVWWGGDRISVPMPPAHRWVQIGVVITEDDARLYVDGTQVGSLGAEGTPLPLTDGSDFWIGSRPAGAASPEEGFSGWMKNWMVFDGDIGDEGMAQLASESGMPEVPLLQHLPLDEGEGTVVADASSNDRDGDLLGGYAWEQTTLAPGAPVGDGIAFITDRDLTVSLAVDANASVPSWIANHYTNSGLSVATTSGDFDLWQRDFGARERVLLLSEGREAGEKNYWAVLSEGPDATTESPDGFFTRSAASRPDWSLQPHSLVLETDSGSELQDATLLTNLTNFDPDRGFQASATIRVPRLQDAGDNAIGLSLLGEADGRGVRAEWLPRTDGGASSLRVVDASNGEILAETAWTGLAPTEVDNTVGVGSGAAETLFSIGAQVFSDNDESVVFAEDFETGGEGWTHGSTNEVTDQWEIGEPTSGPGSAFTGANVAATNLDGDYATSEEDTTAWLRSPVIDLSNTGEATLSFQEYMHVDTFLENGEFLHFGVVSVFDADTLEELERAEYSEEMTTWNERVLDLSGVAGKRIFLEFSLVTDGIDDFANSGWYIDALEVTASGITIESMPEHLAIDGTLYGISTELAGAADESANHLQFTVADRSTSGNDGVTVFVAWDVRASGLEPTWLRDEFTLTDHYVGVSGAAGEHRLWAREYSDGDTVTLGGASAPDSGPFPANINNYFVLFGDARDGLDTFYTLTAEGVRNEGLWEIDFSLTDANGHSETVSATSAGDVEGSSFGIIARHPDAASGSVTQPPVWEIFALSMDFLEGSAGFEAWRETHFAGQLDDLEVSGPEASPAGDGVTNLMKYALDLPPFEPVTSGELYEVDVTGGGDVVLVYLRRTDVDDVLYIPEVSEDLINWSSGEPHVVETTGGVEGNLQEVEAIGTLPEDAEKGFMRLRVMQVE